MIEQVTESNLGVVADIVQLDAAAFGIGGLNEWHLVPLIRHGRVFIYRDNDRVAGSVQYLRDWAEPQTAYMYGITVGESWRGQGIAKKMLQESLALLRRSDITTCELTVDPANTAAVTLYEKFGFHQIDFRENEYGPGEHRLILQLILDKIQPSQGSQPKE